MSGALRTLLFSTLYPSSQRPGHGVFVETRLRELLASGQVQTKVVAPVPWFPSRHARFGARAVMARTPEREVWNGIDVLHPRYPVLPKVGMTIAPWLLAAASVMPIRRLIAQGFDFDVIDAHYFYPDGVAAAWLARHFGKPLAITARGSDLNLIGDYALPRRMMQWAARQAQASIGVSRALVEVLRRWGVREPALHVLRNGVDLTMFALQDMHQARARLNLRTGPVVLSVGNLVENKGHQLIIDAFPAVLAQHPAAQLRIVGGGSQQAALQAQIDNLGLRASVKLVGTVRQSALADWYSASDVLVLASSREGWPNVLLEAMACGTPVLATRVGGTPEIVPPSAPGLLIDERTPAAIAAGLCAMLQQPFSRERVRAHAERFSWQQTTNAQLEIFRALRSTGR